LRHIGTGSGGTQEQFPGLSVQAEQTEHRAECVLRFRGLADDAGGCLGRLERAARLTGGKQAF
jgi:hypothetical protein